MRCVLISSAYFNHSTKCNKVWCLSNWKTGYKPTPWMSACNRTQPPWVQQGHPQPEQMLQLACQSVLHWPKPPLFIFWMERITYSTLFSSGMWNFVAVGHLWKLTNKHSQGSHHQICMYHAILTKMNLVWTLEIHTSTMSSLFREGVQICHVNLHSSNIIINQDFILVKIFGVSPCWQLAFWDDTTVSCRWIHTF